MPQIPRLAAIFLAFAVLLGSGERPLLAAVCFAVLGYFAVDGLIPRVAPAFIKIGLKGTDILKKSKPVLAESMGLVVALVYLSLMICFTPFMFFSQRVLDTEGGGSRLALEAATSNGDYALLSHTRLAEYLSALLSIQAMTILGLADDLFDIRWRHKVLMPAFASIPMLIVYYSDFGVTRVIVPPFLQSLGINAESIDLGWVYYAYMASLTVFCTNCVNIYAGVNGLEVGQSVVLALNVLANDFWYILRLPAQHPAVASHRFSAFVLIPFIGTSLALLRANWWPAKVFVGDTYCYLAGMVFAVVGILGHFSKTLLLMFAPQIFNFFYSVPQLFGIVPCPRHRMPRPTEQGFLQYSEADVTECASITIKVLALLNKIGLVRLRIDKPNNKIFCSNLTIINLVLVHSRPLREDELTMRLLIIQGCWSVVAVFIRHLAARLAFGRDNL